MQTSVITMIQIMIAHIQKYSLHSRAAYLPIKPQIGGSGSLHPNLSLVSASVSTF